MFEDVGRVGHADAQARPLRDHLDEPPQQLRQRYADVPAVRTRVLRGEPNLNDALCKPEAVSTLNLSEKSGLWQQQKKGADLWQHNLFRYLLHQLQLSLVSQIQYGPM